MTPGLVEQAIRRSVTSGARLTTPSDHAQFIVAEISEQHLVLLLGPKQARTPIPWAALEELGTWLPGRRWETVGQTYRTSAEEGTVDGILKKYVRRATANRVVAVFAEARLIDVDIRPLRVRWRGR